MQYDIVYHVFDEPETHQRRSRTKINGHATTARGAEPLGENHRLDKTKILPHVQKDLLPHN